MTCLCQSVEELHKPMKEIKYCTACTRLLTSWCSAPDLLFVTFCNWRKNTNSRIQTSNNADVIAASFFVTKGLFGSLSLSDNRTCLGNVRTCNTCFLDILNHRQDLFWVQLALIQQPFDTISSLIQTLYNVSCFNNAALLSCWQHIPHAPFWMNTFWINNLVKTNNHVF